jgi:cell division protein FtsL
MQDNQWKKLDTGSASSSGSTTSKETVSQEQTPTLKMSRVILYSLVGVLLIFLLVGLFNVWTRMALVQLGYEISALENKNKELKSRARELSLELSSLESPVELEKKARKQGLRLPSVGRIIHVPE